jgi:DNA-binding IclR family transcriptional regulator
MASITDERETPSRSRLLGSASRALQLLEAIAEHRTPVRPPVLGAQLGWSRATLHQHLQTFVAAGWLEATDDGAYQLSLRASWVGRAALEQAGIGERVLPLMRDISQATREAAFLSMLDGDHAYVVERVRPARRVLADVEENSRWSLDTSASGRVLAAFADEEVVADWLARGVRLPSRRELAEVRRENYAVSPPVDEDDDHITAVAVPLRDDRDRCIAALGVIGPGYRLDVNAAVSALRDAVRRFDALWHPARNGAPDDNHKS